MKRLVVLLVGLAVCGVVSPPVRAAAPPKVGHSVRAAAVAPVHAKRVIRATASRVRLWVDAIAWHKCNFTPGWRCTDHRYHPVKCHADVRNQTWHCLGAYLLWKRGFRYWLGGVLGFHIPHVVVVYLAIVRNYPLGLDLWDARGRQLAPDVPASHLARFIGPGIR